MAPETKSFVIDCEAVAWDRENKHILPFQKLTTRKRKNVGDADIKVQVCIFAFDLLYYNGESYVKKQLKERQATLAKAFKPVEGEFDLAKSKTLNAVDDIQTFLDEAVSNRTEGLMLKILDGPEAGYEPSRRSRHWLKVIERKAAL